MKVDFSLLRVRANLAHSGFLGGIAVLAALLMLLLPGQAVAQALYGSIDGNVTDPSSAAIAGATVTARNTGTGESRETITNTAGGYVLPNLQLGTYDVTVMSSGFQPFTQTAVRVSGNSVTRVDVRLQVGVVAEAVTVEAGAVRLQTDQSEVRYEVDRIELQNLPVPASRNFQQTLRLLPGVSLSGSTAIRGSNPAGSLSMNVNGASSFSNNTRIDGASTTSPSHQSLAGYVPALESIEAVEATTNSFDADQGLAGGASINVRIKSGTNEVHGSAFEYHTNNHLKARPFFFPATSEKPRFITNQFGGTIGGPIKRNQLFYFASYERFADRRTFSRFNTVPTAAAKQGNLTESSFPIYDPLTGTLTGENRQAFTGNLIPASRWSSAVQKIIPLWPEPNLPGVANNYFATATDPSNRQTADVKINWLATSKLSTWGRVGYIAWDSYYNTAFGRELGGPTLSGQQPGFADGNVRNVTMAGNYVVTPSIIVDGYFGYNRQDQNVYQERLDEKVGLDFLGIPGTNGPRSFEGGWPRFQFDGYDSVGNVGQQMPWFRRNPTFDYVVNVNWTKGTHNIRLGGELSSRHLNYAQPEVEGQFGGAAGGFDFLSGVTEQRGSARGQRANGFAAFLLGLPQRGGTTLQIPDEYATRTNRHAYYIRDRWTATPRLTLSYGVRWEYYPFPNRVDRGAEVYNFDTNEMILCGFGSIPRDCGVTVSRKGFAPRVGIAYRATDKLVVRAGYGLSQDPYDVATRLLLRNYPVIVAMNLEGVNEFQPFGRLDDGIPLVPVPNLGNGFVPVPRTVVVNAAEPHLPRGYIQSWNFTVQQELKYGFVGQVGYVATRSVRQIALIDANAGQVIGASNNGRVLFPRFGRTAATRQFRPIGTTQYNSLQATLERRYAQGLHLGFNYTWSKTIGLNANTEDTLRVQALDYLNLNRSLVNYDRTHVLNVVNIWELPFGKGKRWASSSGIASSLLSGWQVNNTLALMTGPPLSITASATSLGMPGSTQRADQVKPTVQKLGGAGRGQSFFDPLAFRPVTQPRFGTAGFNSLRGPGIVNWDMGVFRQFTLTERWQLQFRAEAFNFTNTPHFANPGSNASNMSLNTDGTLRALGGFSEITSTNGNNIGRGGEDERTLRFGLRLSF